MKKRQVVVFFAISVLALTQIGVSAHALLEASMSELRFVEIGTGANVVKSGPKTVTLTNHDNMDVTIESVSSSEMVVPGSFSITGFPVTLKHGENATLTVTFNSPKSEIVIDQENGTPVTLVLAVRRSGVLTPESLVRLQAYKSVKGISATPLRMSFGSVKKGSISAASVIAINNPTRFTFLVRMDPNQNTGFILADGQIKHMTLSGLSEQTYVVRFQPTVEGLQSGNLQIVTDDKDALLLGTIPLDGKGIAADVPSTVKEEEKTLAYGGGIGCQATSFGKTAGDASSLVLFSAALGLLILFRSLMVQKRKAA